MKLERFFEITKLVCEFWVRLLLILICGGGILCFLGFAVDSCIKTYGFVSWQSFYEIAFSIVIGLPSLVFVVCIAVGEGDFKKK